VFIVIALGSGPGLLVPASIGALGAFVVVLATGALVHRPLSRVPENALKFGVGVMLSAFGVFWTGEGLGVDWPSHDAAIPAMATIFLGMGLAMVPWLRRWGSENAA
jgi:Ca2+/H+ antiporter, TMEM165/GDT1 family